MKFGTKKLFVVGVGRCGRPHDTPTQRLIELPPSANLSNVTRQKTTQLELFGAQRAMDLRSSVNLGFSTSVLSQIAMPVDDPGDDCQRWGRRNAGLMMIVTPGSEPDGFGGVQSTKIPWGVPVRALNFWMCTEIRNTKSPVLQVDAKLATYMKRLGYRNTGGANGARDSFKEQLKRWLNASITIVDETAGPRRDTVVTIRVSKGWSLNWLDDDGDNLAAGSRIVVSSDFFEEVMRAPVPIDIDAWRALRGSATRLDLFTWLTYTMFSLKTPVHISYEKLRQHFGTSDATDRHTVYNFKRLILKHLAKVREVYPEANVDPDPDGLWLRPSRPHVPLKGDHEASVRRRAATVDQRYAAALAADKGLIPMKVPTRRRKAAQPVAKSS